MKLKNSYSLASALALASLLILTSCDKDEATPGANQINLQSPAVNQENFYLQYQGTCADLQPTGDTLILRIKSFDGTNLELEEILTEGSPNYYPQSNIYPAKWSSDILDIKPEFRQSSALFFFYGSDSLKLNMAPSVQLAQNSCLVWKGQEVFTGDYLGVIPTFRVGEQNYKQKKVVSCVPSILDLDGYLLYDNRNLYSSFTSAAQDWPPSPDPIVRAYALVDVDN